MCECVFYATQNVLVIIVGEDDWLAVSTVPVRPWPRPWSRRLCFLVLVVGLTRPPDRRPAAEMFEETIALAAVTVLGILEQGERAAGKKNPKLF